MPKLTRRTIAAGLLSAATLPKLADFARAEDAGLYPFKDDGGRPVFNYRLPSELAIDAVPGTIWVGPKTATAVLVEFFDYNCPYCRTAAPQLAEFVQKDGALRLGLVNNPILGLGSVQAAKVQQAVLRGLGPAKAASFHLRLLGLHQPVDGPLALATAGAMGFDAKALETAADLPQIGDVLKKQTLLAASLGFDATPSFVIGDTGVPGYPGIASLARAVADSRRCGKLVC